MFHVYLLSSLHVCTEQPALCFTQLAVLFKASLLRILSTVHYSTMTSVFGTILPREQIVLAAERKISVSAMLGEKARGLVLYCNQPLTVEVTKNIEDYFENFFSNPIGSGPKLFNAPMDRDVFTLYDTCFNDSRGKTLIHLHYASTSLDTMARFTRLISTGTINLDPHDKDYVSSIHSFICKTAQSKTLCCIVAFKKSPYFVIGNKIGQDNMRGFGWVAEHAFNLAHMRIFNPVKVEDEERGRKFTTKIGALNCLNRNTSNSCWTFVLLQALWFFIGRQIFNLLSYVENKKGDYVNLVENLAENGRKRLNALMKLFAIIFTYMDFFWYVQHPRYGDLADLQNYIIFCPLYAINSKDRIADCQLDAEEIFHNTLELFQELFDRLGITDPVVKSTLDPSVHLKFSAQISHRCYKSDCGVQQENISFEFNRGFVVRPCLHDTTSLRNLNLVLNSANAPSKHIKCPRCGSETNCTKIEYEQKPIGARVVINVPRTTERTPEQFNPFDDDWGHTIRLGENLVVPDFYVLYHPSTSDEHNFGRSGHYTFARVVSSRSCADSPSTADPSDQKVVTIVYYDDSGIPVFLGGKDWLKFVTMIGGTVRGHSPIPEDLKTEFGLQQLRDSWDKDFGRMSDLTNGIQSSITFMNEHIARSEADPTDQNQLELTRKAVKNSIEVCERAKESIEIYQRNVETEYQNQGLIKHYKAVSETGMRTVLEASAKWGR